MATNRGQRREAPGLVVFDLDNTLLAGRTILELGRRYKVSEKVQTIWNAARQQELAAGWEESQSIASLFAGQHVEEFQTACAAVPLRDDAAATVRALKKRGFLVGVASASYHVATKAAQERLGLDLEIGARLEVVDNRLTGKLLPSSFQGPCRQFVCKESVLKQWKEESGATFSVGVGDGANDVCLIRAADLGVSFGDAHPKARQAAKAHIDTLSDLIPLLDERARA